MRFAAWNELKLPSNCRKEKPFQAQLWGKVLLNSFLALEDMKVDQGLSKHAIPWFVVVGVLYWTWCNSTHGPSTSRVLGKSLECPCAHSKALRAMHNEIHVFPYLPVFYCSGTTPMTQASCQAPIDGPWAELHHNTSAKGYSILFKGCLAWDADA